MKQKIDSLMQRIEKRNAQNISDLALVKKLISKATDAKKEAAAPIAKMPRFNLLTSNGTPLLEKPVSKRVLFNSYINFLAPDKSADELNVMFPSRKYQQTYPLVITAEKLKQLPASITARYIKCENKTRDGEVVFTSGHWGDWINRKEQIPGNFPELKKELRKQGMKLVTK